jgi:DHA2 family multidrug resistance protein-like MFS transporter
MHLAAAVGLVVMIGAALLAGRLMRGLPVAAPASEADASTADTPTEPAPII